jgi:hypothetical protein
MGFKKPDPCGGKKIRADFFFHFILDMSFEYLKLMQWIYEYVPLSKGRILVQLYSLHSVRFCYSKRNRPTIFTIFYLFIRLV